MGILEQYEVMRLKGILLKLAGIAMFLAGAFVSAGAFLALLGNGSDTFEPPFSWSLLALALAGLLVAAGGVVIVLKGVTKPRESISLKIHGS